MKDNKIKLETTYTDGSVVIVGENTSTVSFEDKDMKDTNSLNRDGKDKNNYGNGMVCDREFERYSMTEACPECGYLCMSHNPVGTKPKQTTWGDKSLIEIKQCGRVKELKPTKKMKLTINKKGQRVWFCGCGIMSDSGTKDLAFKEHLEHFKYFSKKLMSDVYLCKFKKVYRIQEYKEINP